MSKKIDKIISRFKKDQDQINALTLELDELSTELKATKAKAEEAAEAGDVDAYTELKAKADATENLIHVKKAVVKKASALVDLGDAREAWQEYAGSVEAAFEKASSTLGSCIDRLAETMRERLEMQKTIRTKRDSLTQAAGLTPKFVLDNPARNNFPIYINNGPTLDAVRNLLLVAGKITLEESDEIVRVINDCRIRQ